MKIEKLLNTKCNCKICNGTGIAFTMNDGKDGYMCTQCMGNGFYTENEIFKIGEKFYKTDGKNYVEVEVFFSKRLIPTLERVNIANPYAFYGIIYNTIAYSEFMDDNFKYMDIPRGCPLDYLTLVGCEFDESLCPLRRQIHEYENYIDYCPNGNETKQCWEKIEHPAFARIRKFNK